MLKQKYDEASASAGVEGEKEPPESNEYPVVRKKFRVTIDVAATLAAAENCSPLLRARAPHSGAYGTTAGPT